MSSVGIEKFHVWTTRRYVHSYNLICRKVPRTLETQAFNSILHWPVSFPVNPKLCGEVPSQGYSPSSPWGEVFQHTSAYSSQEILRWFPGFLFPRELASMIRKPQCPATLWPPASRVRCSSCLPCDGSCDVRTRGDCHLLSFCQWVFLQL